MDILIRSIDLTATGREIVRDRKDSVEVVTIGRSTENTIHLPDLAVEQRHVALTPDSAGNLHAEAMGTLGFTANGVSTKAAIIDPASGGEIGLGNFQIAVGKGEDGAVIFTIKSKADDGGESKDQLAGFGIGSVLPSRRITSWAAALAIIVAFLAVPVITHLTRERVVHPDINAEGAVLMDASWSAGDLSMAHHGLENNCESCHVNAFEAVRDEACQSCHTEEITTTEHLAMDPIENHAALDRQVSAMPPFSRGDQFLWRVAGMFGKPGPAACTECHTEHSPAAEIMPGGQQFCADCHGVMDERLADTELANASDFARSHPEFQVMVSPSRGAEPVRVRYTAATVENSGIKFTHDQHMSTTNGVARMAMRLGLTGASGGLTCDNCHRVDEDAAGPTTFAPVVMEESCEQCHSLVFDRRGGAFRSLTHGNVQEMQAQLASRDRTPRRPVTTGRRRPGMFAEGGIYYGNFSRVTPGRLTRADLAEGGLCGECHYPAAGGDVAVLEVRQPDRFFEHGWFDHGAHGADVMGTDSDQAACASCHGRSDTLRPVGLLGSDSADDLLLPDYASCRDCHYGEEAPANLAALANPISSTCAMCHSYHPPAGIRAPPRHAALLRSGREREQ